VAKELRSLSSTDRDAVLLELRSHLTDLAARGDERLDAALRALGSPADLAAEFDHVHGAGLVQVPQVFAVPRRPMRVSEVLLEVRATFLASRDGLMMVGLVMTAVMAGTAFPVWTNARLDGVSVGVGAAMAAEFAIFLLAACAAYRIILSDEPHPWRIKPSSFRFFAAMIAVDLVTFGAWLPIFLGIRRFASAAGTTPAISLVAMVISGAAVSILLFCVTLRIQPWLVAQAIGRYEITIGASWRGTSGWVLNILRGWIVLVVPLYLLHVGLNNFVLVIVSNTIVTLALAVVAGVVAMSLMFAAILLNATIFRWAVGEPIPSARPFATEPADASTIEEARVRLAVLLRSQQTKQES
jgi:hypothetical protein